MTFYIYRNKDETIHVQNVFMGHFGQHHVHTEEGFKKWKKDINEAEFSVMSRDCDCGLKASQVKDHHGNITTNDRF